jgi:hypothetical protein
MITTDDVRAALYADHWGEQKIEAFCDHIDELQAKLEAADIENHTKHMKIWRLEATIERMKPYMRHKPTCNTHVPYTEDDGLLPCDCGLAELQDELKT